MHEKPGTRSRPVPELSNLNAAIPENVPDSYVSCIVGGVCPVGPIIYAEVELWDTYVFGSVVVKADIAYMDLRHSAGMKGRHGRAGYFLLDGRGVQLGGKEF